jgi:transcriptional regulator NrdR family protein
MNIGNVTTVRVNITVPEMVWSELEQEIPQRGKSAFISKAIEEKLRSKKREKALKKLASLPPTFVDISDASQYIREMRQKDDKKRNSKLAL